MRWLAVLTLAHATLAAVLGIDYGTDFTKAALVAPYVPFEIVLTQDSKRKDVSGLLLKPVGKSGELERVYGSSGVSQISRLPGNSLYSLKTVLGASKEDISVALFEQLHPGLDIIRSDRDSVSFNISGTIWPVEEAVGMLLSEVRSRATGLLQDKVRNSAEVRAAALTAPGHFKTSQRVALRDAATLAGLDVISLVDDGVAVAVNFASNNKQLTAEKQYFIVYDMGAMGTTSTLVSLRQTVENGTVVEVEGYGGDPTLGGHALTALLREMLFAKSRFPVEARTPRVLSRLWAEAERAKMVLSVNNDVNVFVESLWDDRDINVKVSRSEFEKNARPQKSAALEPLLDSLTTFDGATPPIEAVLLHGGATRTPFVQEQLQKANLRIAKNVNADEAATLGATLYGVGLSGIFKMKPMTVIDRIPWEFKASFNGKKAVDLFPRGSITDSTLKVELPESESVDIELLEGGKSIDLWSIPNAKTVVNNLREPGFLQCVGPAKIMAEFKLTTDRTVKLVDVEAVCDAKSLKTSTKSGSSSATTATNVESASSDEVSSSYSEAESPTVTPTVDSSSTTPSSSSTSTETTTTTSSTKSAPRIKSRKLTIRSKPLKHVAASLGSSEKQQLMQHMRQLDKEDAARRKFDTVHNELESLLYRLMEQVPGEKLVSELLEKLYDPKPIEELSKQLDTAKSLWNSLTSSESSESTADATGDDTAEMSSSSTSNEETSETNQSEDDIDHSEL